MKLQKKSNKKALRYALIGVVLLAIVTGAVMYYFMRQQPSVDTKQPTINYDPPSKQEQGAGDEQKDINSKEQEQQNNQPNPTQANVVAEAGQYGDQVEIRAFVSNVFEEGGGCKATLQQGTATVSREVSAFTSATTTQCQPIDISRSEFKSAGEWKLTVSYTSKSMTGSSRSQSLTIR